MGFNQYHLQILLRLVLIIITSYLTVYVFLLDTYRVTFGNLAALSALQIFLLFRYLTRWQKDLDVIQNAVLHDDYSFQFHLVKNNHPLYKLYNTLNHVARYVGAVKADAEIQSQYLNYILENAQVGLMIYEANGSVLLSNEEFRNLISIASLESVDQIRAHNEQLYQELVNLKPNKPHLITTKGENPVKLSARLSKIVVKAETLLIISLINIKPELDESELQSWQDLMSVLTHEIMNSVAPIHSLNGTMSKYLDKVQGNEEVVSKAKNSLAVINRRSESLMSFVARYRTISTVPLPHKQSITVRDVLQSVTHLLSGELKGIHVVIDSSDEKIYADPSQVEQVLINLLKNAAHAVVSTINPMIRLAVITKENEIVISVADNGKGIDPGILEKIFMPFFTTRPSGSGIGLTISRQIMHRHEGTLTVSSIAGNGTTFYLTFPKA
jgi:two-component system, NtrC family, nitrogen regulation sensor histidine kinase NtrY